MKEKKVSKRLLRKAVRSLTKRFKDEFALSPKDFEFHAVWIDEYVNCLLFNVVKKNSKLFGSTVGYQLS